MRFTLVIQKPDKFLENYKTKIMLKIKLETSKALVDNIIDAYNKEYNASITTMDIESLILDVPFIKLNGKEVSWSSVYLYD